ncbi:MAG: 30S ribosomal protein S3 [archaeon]
MIERKFVAQKLKERQVQEYVAQSLTKAGHSKVEIKRTPMGEKIIVYTTRPGLIVGRKGENIKRLTQTLKKRFNLENPQIEIGEIGNPLLDSGAVADQIAYTFERFGPKRFKFIGYDMLSKIMGAGAIGAEIVIGGRGVPGSRAKSWRFSAGYLKKSGNIAQEHVDRATVVASLKTGSIGVKVMIMHPDIQLPDKITIREIDKKVEITPIPTEKIEEKKEEKPKKKERKPRKKAEKPEKEKQEDGTNKEE